MTNKLTEETAARTLRISQSLIRKTRSEITQEMGNGSTHPLCCSGKLSDKETTTEASILFLFSEGISFGCYFPFDVNCKLVSIRLASAQDFEECCDYCNSQYQPYQALQHGWYNAKVKTFIRLFFDMEEDSYMLNVMDMADDIGNELDNHGIN